MTKTFHLNNYRLEPEQLSILSSRLLEDLDNILTFFEVSGLKFNTKKVYGKCPIHGGDGKTNPFNMFLTGDTYSGNWKCRSHNCHIIFKQSFLGLIRGLLSMKQGWSQQGDHIVSFGDVIKWSIDWLKIKTGDLQVDQVELNKKVFIRQNSKLIVNEIKNNISREVVRQHLSYPAKTFISRGFSSEILDKYDIGVCNDPKREMHNRVVVPIYDKTGVFMVGCSGRSIYNQCSSCKLYHPLDIGCPDVYNKYKYLKWVHSKNFRAEQTLFNSWNASQYIKKCNTAIITESVGNVLKLEESGIKIGLGTFGTQFTEYQNIITNELGVLNLIVAPDIDEHKAGITWANMVKEKYKRIYNIYIIDKLPKQDIGEMSIEEIHGVFDPLLRKLKVII